MWILIIVAIIAVVIGVTIGLKQRGKINELLEEGRMIKRDISFVETAELFTLATVSFDGLIEAVKKMDLSGTGVSIDSNSTKQALLFKSTGWSAQLYRMEEDGDKSIYCFSFLNWRTYRGIPQDHIQMNILLTEIEKAFLRIDPNTQVQTSKLKLNTKTSFF